MKKFIGTYFYQHKRTENVLYGNIKLSPKERDETYWNTIQI